MTRTYNRENYMREFRIAAIAAAMLAAGVASGWAAQKSTVTQQPQADTAQEGAVPDALVHKVGAALRQTATIRQKYTQRAQAASTPEQKQALSSQVETEMMRAISDQGLSLQQYNQVIQMAQADPALKQRVLSAAQSGG
jgi:hypothetical protein